MTVILMQKAENEGIEISETWDGTTPPFLVGKQSLGWWEAINCLYFAAIQQHDERAVALTANLDMHMRKVAPTVVSVTAWYKELGGKSSPRLVDLYNLLVIVHRSMTVIGVRLKDAYRDTLAITKEHVRLNHPLYKVEVYNRCLMEVEMRDFLEELNSMLFSYTNKYFKWVSS